MVNIEKLDSQSRMVKRMKQRSRKQRRQSRRRTQRGGDRCVPVPLGGFPKHGREGDPCSRWFYGGPDTCERGSVCTQMAKNGCDDFKCVMRSNFKNFLGK